MADKAIKVNMQGLDDGIKKLEGLKKTWSSDKGTLPEKQGGGKTVTELHAVGKMYQDMHTAMNTLLDVTVSYMNGAKETFQQMDQNLADAIENE